MRCPARLLLDDPSLTLDRGMNLAPVRVERADQDTARDHVGGALLAFGASRHFSCDGKSRLQFWPMVISILRNICEHLAAVDATYKARLCCDIYGSGKNPFFKRMRRQFPTAVICYHMSSVTISAFPMVPRNT